MTVSLSKTQFFVIALLAILMLPISGRIFFLLTSTKTIGQVNNVQIYHSQNGAKSYEPIVEFYTKDSVLTTFAAVENSLFTIGEKVPVLFN